MKLLYRRCAGLDIHRDTVSACVRRRVKGQSEPVVEEQVFGTFTQDLERLRTWLRKNKVRQVAMEVHRSLLDPGLECVGVQQATQSVAGEPSHSASAAGAQDRSD